MRQKKNVLICFILFLILILNPRTINAKGEINVKSYGASGNGVSDDSIYIQQAIDYAYSENGGTVIIPEGVYNVSSLIILKKGVSITGDNAIIRATKKGSIITCKGNNKISGLNIIGLMNPSNKTISKEKWQNRYQDGNDVLISVFSADDVVFESCVIQNNMCEGIKSRNNRRLTISNCIFSNLDCGYIAQGDFASDIKIENSNFDGYNFSEPISIYSTKANNIELKNNTITNKPNGIGILVGRSSKNRNEYTNINVEGNTILNCSVGIEFRGVQNGKIINNSISNMHHGITITKSNSVTVQNNQIDTTLFHGMNIDDSITVTMNKNEFININKNNKDANITIPCIYVKNSNAVYITDSIFQTSEKNKYALNLIGNIDNLFYASNDTSMLIYLANVKKMTNSQIITTQAITGNFKSSSIDKSSSIYQYSSSETKKSYNYKFLEK